MYRKVKWCPVPGCLAKPQKKLSNHIIRAHKHITPEERACFLKKAKTFSVKDPKPSVVTDTLTIKGAFKMATTRAAQAKAVPSPKVIHPPHKPRVGKTHHYSRYCTISNEILSSFRDYMTTVDGGRKGDSEAKQVAEDVSKYLYFADNTDINIQVVVDANKLNNYTTKLFDKGVGIEGVITKLDRVTLFIDYLAFNNHLNHTTVERTRMRLKKWRQSFRKQRKGLEADRMDQFVENPPDTEPLRRLLNSREVRDHFASIGERAMDGQVVTPSEVNEYGSYLFGLFVHLNGQRPSSVSNLRVKDVANATTVYIGGHQKMVVRCSSHKTAHAYGAAKLTLDEKFFHILELYSKHIRPNIETDLPYFLVTATGRQYRDHTYYLQKLCKDHDIGKLPTATEMRKVVATASAGLSPEKQNTLAKHMCHSGEVHERYYQATHSTERAAQAATIIPSIIEGISMAEILDN